MPKKLGATQQEILRLIKTRSRTIREMRLSVTDDKAQKILEGLWRENLVKRTGTIIPKGDMSLKEQPLWRATDAGCKMLRDCA